jgi:hypothetical protein
MRRAHSGQVPTYHRSVFLHGDDLARRLQHIPTSDGHSRRRNESTKVIKEIRMKKLIAIAGSLALASGMAVAGVLLGEGMNFEDVDKNQDGVITQSEASTDQNLVAHFNNADANADGYLTPSEFDAVKEEMEEAE